MSVYYIVCDNNLPVFVVTHIIIVQMLFIAGIIVILTPLLTVIRTDDCIGNLSSNNR